ncbi:MAG: hypothetical protein ACM3NV_09525 [Syntrophothermus sp.]
MKRLSARILLVFSLCLAGLAPAAHAAAAPLALDPSFGQGGIVRGGTGVPDYRSAAGVAVAPGGDVLVVGVGSEGTAVARYLPNGKPDPGYGQGGIADLDGSVPAGDSTSLESVGGINDLAVDSRGRALLLWRGSKLTRLTAGGEIDRSFGVAGTVTLSGRLTTPHFVRFVTLANGRILLAGYGYGSSRMYVQRLLADGSPDRSFGTNGLASVVAGNPKRNAAALRLAVGPGGDITLAGFASQRPALVRLLADGKPDRAFGQDGRAVLPSWLGGQASALTLTSGGGAMIGCRCWNRSTGSRRLALLRFGPRGRLDRRFFAASLVRERGGNGFRPTALLLTGGWILAAGGGQGPSLRIFHADGRPGPSLAGVEGVPSDRFSGVFAAAQGEKPLLLWTPKAQQPPGAELLLERFLVR